MKSMLQAILVTLFVSAVVACNSPDQVKSPSFPKVPGSPGSPAPAPGTNTSPGVGSSGPVSMGTGDGAGGNLCQGKPIESYPYELTKRPAFIKYVKPILDRAPLGDMQRLFTYAIRSKKWYAPPCELKLLDAERIGSSIKTDQGALQNFTEVWQSALQFKEMEKQPDPEKAEAELIMHEIGMSLRLIHLDSPKQQCLSYAPQVQLCDGMSEIQVGQPKDLTKRDYEMVRRFTIDIFNFTGTSLADWEDFLGTREFEISAGKPMRTKAERQEYMASQIAKSWADSQISGHIPTKGELIRRGALETSEKCSAKIIFDDSIELIRVQVTTPRGVLDGVFNMPSKVQPASQKKLNLATVYLWDLGGRPVGERFLRGTLYLSGETIVAVALSEMIVIDAKSNRNPQDGFTYYCSMDHLSAPVLHSN